MPIKKYSIPPPSTTTTSTTTINNSCTNPVFELFKGEYIKSSNYFYILDLLRNIFDTGTIEINCKNCCPTCSNFYNFSCLETYQKLIEAADDLENLDCCRNIKYSEYDEIGCSTTDFISCLNTLKGIIGDTNYDQLVSIGIVEVSTIGGNKTIICQFLQELQNSPVYSPTLVFNFFYAMLQIGINIVCLNNGMISISSTETFLKLIEAVGTNSFLN